MRIDEYTYVGRSARRTPGEAVLRDLAFSLAPGDRLCILGPSGCGKSTLLRLLVGFAAGEGVAIGNETTARGSTPLAGWTRDQDVFGLVPQVPSLFPWKTVEGNLKVALPRGLLPRKEQRERDLAQVRELLAAVGLTGDARKYPWQISAGMAARVSFARAQLLRAPCLLLDEPFAALDALTRRSLQVWLRGLLARDTLPCVLVTHDVREALSLGTRIVVLGRPGERAAQGLSSVVATFEGFEDSPAWEKRVLEALGGE